MRRRTFIRNIALASGMMAVAPMAACSGNEEDYDFPLMDLHVHLRGGFTIESLMEISRATNVQFGVVENPGGRIRDDESLRAYIDALRPYPVYIGLQPMSPGWTANFSPEAIAELDYVLMDPQTVPNGNNFGETLRIWNVDTYVDDTEYFMEAYMDRYLEVINNNEPLTTLGWPLFLPACIARDYYKLWTKERMETIITAVKNRDLNIEINDLAHTPHEEFILMAKKEGIKFAFGSDTADNKAGRLSYCKEIARKCKLTRKDFFVPDRVLPA
jgi:hypothetical protein